MNILGVIIIADWLFWPLVITTGLYLFFTWRFKELKELGIDGPKPYPVVGNFHLFNTHGLYDNDWILTKKYGKIFSFYEGRNPTIVCGDVKILREVLVKDFNSFVNRRPMYMRGLLKDGVFDAEGSHWKEMRNLLTPGFSSGKLKHMVPAMTDCAKLLVDAIDETVEKEKPFEAKRMASAFTMDVIARTVFSLNINTQKDPDNSFSVKAKKLFDEFDVLNPIFLIVFLFPFLVPLLELFGMKSAIPEDTEGFFRDILTQLLDQRRTEETKHHDFVQMMLDSEKDLAEADSELSAELHAVEGERKGLTTNEILAQCFLFFTAGYETTATTLSFVLYNLALYQDVQDKLHEEIDNIMGSKDTIAYEKLSKTHYMDMVINETFRMFPPITRLDRRASRDVDYGGFKIPKDMVIVYPIRALHMDPEIYPDPEKFIPERFTAEEKAKRDPFCFMPFGMGPRNCIGMRLALLEIKIALATLLHGHRIVTCDKTQVPLKFERQFFPLPKEGVWLKAEKRDR